MKVWHWAVVSSNDFQNMATASLAGVGPSTEHWSVFFVHWASSYCPLRYMFVQVNSMHRVVKILPSFFTTEDVINLVSSLENSIFLWVLWRTTFKVTIFARGFWTSGPHITTKAPSCWGHVCHLHNRITRSAQSLFLCSTYNDVGLSLIHVLNDFLNSIWVSLAVF